MNISYEKSENVLLLSLALCGWKYENVYSKMRQVPDIYSKIQRELINGGFDFGVFDKYFSNRNPYWFFRWVSRHTDFPEYKLLRDATAEEAKYYKNFDEDCRLLFSSIDISVFRGMCEPYLAAEIAKYEARIPGLIKKATTLLPANKEITRIVICPNYLAIVGSGFAIMDGEKLIIIAGPPKNKEDDLSDLLVHEYLHSVVNPLTEKFFTKRELVTPEGIVDSFYRENHKEYWIVLNEYIIRALTARVLDNPAHIEREKTKRGFSKIDEVYSEICKFPSFKREASFRDMLEGVDKILR